MIPAPFEYFAPGTLDEAISLLRTYGEEAKILAGGQSLIPLMKLRLASPGYLIDIGRIPGLSYIRQEDGAIAIGALSTHSSVEHSELLKARLPLLAEAAAQIGDRQVRNRGTIGGSLSHADPSADLPAVAMALEAEMVIQRPSSRRTVSASQFFVDMFTTDLQPDEVLVEVRCATQPANTGSAYKKAFHKASFYAVVGVAAIITLDEDNVCRLARIGITGLTSKAFRAEAVEAALIGQQLEEGAVQAAAKLADKDVEPLSDFYASAEYRAHLARVYTARAIREAISGA